MNYVTQNDLVSELQAGLIEQPRTALVDYTERQVNYGFAEKPNFEYCAEHGIPCVDIGRMGGAFVVNKGDIGLGHVAKGFDNTVGYEIYMKFTEYLKNKGLNAEANDNDILIDGYKVFGWASKHYQQQDATFITCHFSMSVDIELINAICTKPMNKIPKGLSDFGVTREEVINFLENYINKQGGNR